MVRLSWRLSYRQPHPPAGLDNGGDSDNINSFNWTSLSQLVVLVKKRRKNNSEVSTLREMAKLSPNPHSILSTLVYI